MKHPYIYGDCEHPERVIAALEARGGVNSKNHMGKVPDFVYFIDETENNIIMYTGSLYKDLITTHPDWEEVYIEPDFLCPNGDGYGDYVIMHIDRNGYIKDWRFFDSDELQEFIDESY